MSNIKAIDRDLAKEFYLHTNWTQADIAKRLGISQKTMSAWVVSGEWAAEKEAMQMTVPRMVMELVRQLNELQTEIKSREPGKRYADSKEAHIQSSLVRDIKNLQAGQSLAAYTQAVIEIEMYLRGNNTYSDEFVEKVGLAMADFIQHITKILSAKK